MQYWWASPVSDWEICSDPFGAYLQDGVKELWMCADVLRQDPSCKLLRSWSWWVTCGPGLSTIGVSQISFCTVLGLLSGSCPLEITVWIRRGGMLEILYCFKLWKRWPCFRDVHNTEQIHWKKYISMLLLYFDAPTCDLSAGILALLFIVLFWFFF